ncbi:peptidylprolyl isomerase [Patescibacteria group bacterium]|nr:peptidylprolyl isomerase [Patescibacteria group bacterium]
MEKENTLKNKAVSSVNNSVSGFLLKTNKGIIEIDFYQDQAPETVNNFIKLAESGFYNGTRFHRIIEGFMIQGGDPLSKDVSQKAAWGTGGPGYTFADEIGENNRNEFGTIAMANAGPNTNGSQFFINVNDNFSLDTRHTVFGKVVNGVNILMEISQVETTLDPSGREESSPVEDVILESVVLK